MPTPPRTRPRTIRLDEAPATLPAALADVWAAGDAAVVASPDAALPPAVEAALTGELPVPHGTALVVPTSGSTGDPRAVLLGHAALEESTGASLAALGCAPGERWALALPLRHVAGLQVLARARALGTAPFVVSDPGDPEAIAAAAEHVEHIALVPTQLVRCLDAGSDVITRLVGLRSVLVGGGPLAPSRATEAREAGIPLTLSYGMTETCGGCVYDGVPLDGVEVAVDDAGRIRLRGPMRATGYLGASPEDAARFTDDGWFITDDVGRLRPAPGDGTPTLEVLGRADDVINTGGVKVAPVAVEAALRDVAGVADVVVLGVADPEWGERVRAVVVPTGPDVAGTLTLESLRLVVTARLSAAHAPAELVLVERIVRDGLGKVSAAERERLRR